MRERDDDLCYCKPGFTGHVHAAKVSDEVWAAGVLAIDFLGRGSMSTSNAEANAEESTRSRGDYETS